MELTLLNNCKINLKQKKLKLKKKQIRLIN